MSILDAVFILLPGCAFVFFIVSFILLRLTLDRRVRNSLPKDKVYDSTLDWYFGLGRTMCFGCAVVFEFHNRSYEIKSAYNEINIKRFANAFEKAIA